MHESKIQNEKKNQSDTKITRSFATTVSELTRGSSTGASGGKGHVKSASVSSPGPSAVENSTSGAQQSDSLGPRYQINFKHKHTNRHTQNIPTNPQSTNTHTK